MIVPSFFRLLGLVAAQPPESDAYAGAFDGLPIVEWARPLPAAESGTALQTELGQPVIHGDRVYLGSSQENALLVLDRANGVLVGRLEAAAPVAAAPVIGEDRLWFTDSAGYTWCYPLVGGDPLWKHFAGAPLLAAPAVHQGRLYVNTVDDVVYALDAATGTLVWRHAQRLDAARANELELFGAPQPIPELNLVLSGHSDGTLVALDAATGDVLWQRRVGEGRFPDVIAPATVVGGVVMVMGYSEPMVALDLKTQVVRWRQDVGGAQRPVVVGAQMFQGGTDGVLRALEVESGDVRWSWDSGTGGALTEPVSTPAGLLVGSAVGGLYLIDPADGALRWTLDTGLLLNGVTVPPAVDGRQALVLTNAGNLVSLVVPAPAAPATPRLPTGERAPTR